MRFTFCYIALLSFSSSFAIFSVDETYLITMIIIVDANGGGLLFRRKLLSITHGVVNKFTFINEHKILNCKWMMYDDANAIPSSNGTNNKSKNCAIERSNWIGDFIIVYLYSVRRTMSLLNRASYISYHMQKKFNGSRFFLSPIVINLWGESEWTNQLLIQVYYLIALILCKMTHTHCLSICSDNNKCAFYASNANDFHQMAFYLSIPSIFSSLYMFLSWMKFSFGFFHSIALSRPIYSI